MPPGLGGGAAGRSAPEASEVCAVDVAALVAASNAAAQPRARANVAPTLAALQMVRRAPSEVTVAVDAAPPAEAPGADAERVCRVCLVGDGDAADADEPTGPLVELRCACRGGMRLAHAVCAERWFISKGSGMCEICHQQAWELSLAALQEAAAKRAAAAARNAASVLSPEALRLQRQREAWEYTESARTRLMLANVAILLGLGLAALSDAVLSRTKASPKGANIFIAFVCAALCVAAARDMIAWRLRWFTTRAGLAVITVIVSVRHVLR